MLCQSQAGANESGEDIAQEDEPVGKQAIRANPARNPLLWLAAAVMGIHDHLGWWVDWLGRIAAWLAALSRHLAARDGDR